jgi:protein-tyrosine-phosphatase
VADRPATHHPANHRAGSAAGKPRFRSVLIICAANTARSVIAEHLLRRELKARGAESHVRVTSAGIAPYARDGALVSLDTRLTLRDEGIELHEEATSTDLRRHPELLHEAEVIIAMTRAQAEELRAKFPAAGHLPVHTWREFGGESGDIEDPFEKGDVVFAACREEIKRLLPRVVERLLG